MEILPHIDEIPYWDGESLPQIYFVRDSFNHIIPAIKIHDWSFFDSLKGLV